MELDEVKEAVDEFFSDSSRPVSETRDGLQELRDEIDIKLDTLESSED